MKTWMKTVAMGASIAMLIGAGGCGSSRGGSATSSEASGKDPSSISVGISMPEQQLERWKKDGSNLKQILEKRGYKVVLQYADGKVDQQTSQIQNMANQGADIVVIASLDGVATGAAAETAKDNGATVIAYDRMIMNTDAVDYYTSFDNTKIGEMQGEYIVKKLGLDQGKKGPFNVELMSGSPDDNNAKYYFEGSWSKLGQYFESGVLQSRSGKVPKSVDDWQTIGIQNWDRQKAQAEMENRINSFYGDGERLDAVLASNDALALGTVNAVESAGWDYYPIITGQDAEKANVQAIVQGRQTMSVYKDFRKLADITAGIIDDVVAGKTPKTQETYPNGNKDVPSIMAVPEAVDKDNVKSLLVDSGYISAEDAGLK